MTKHGAVVGCVALALSASGCGSGDPGPGSASTPSSTGGSTGSPSSSPDPPSDSSSPGTIGMGARCPTTLPAVGLPRADRTPASRGHVVSTTTPGQVLLCRYRAHGRGFTWDGDRQLTSSSDRAALVEDLRALEPRPDQVTRCMIVPQPTPFVLVLAMPNDAVHLVRADADPTCAYAGAVTTNGFEDFAPVGNDLLEAWRSGRWEGVTS